MHYSTLGQTGLLVSTIGFGASPLGNVFGTVTIDAAHRTVAVAIDNGINLFDVSPYYGLTVAEDRLGAALENGKRPHVYLATKCGRYGDTHFDFSAKTITREFERSLRRLRTDYVDLLQAHDIEFGNVQQIINETLPAMERLRQQGKVRFLGLTGYWPGLLARLAEMTHLDCVLNYCHANLFADDMKQQLVPVATKTGLGLLNASPLHMGLLGEKPIPGWHPAPQEVKDAAAEIRRLCVLHGLSAAQVAIQYCTGLNSIASTLVGFSSPAEVTEACSPCTLPDSLLDEIDAIVWPVKNIFWPSGLAENQDPGKRVEGDAAEIPNSLKRSIR